MQSQRMASIFALAFATCELQNSYGKLYNERYIIKGRDGTESDLYRQYYNYHSYLIGGAWAERMTVTEIDSPHSIKFTVTASWRALQRVNEYCAETFNGACEMLTATTATGPDPSDWHLPIADEKKGDPKWTNAKVKNVVCVYQRDRDGSDDCRKCLMQISNSIIGDFHFHYYGERGAIAYVMHTSHEKQNIIDACLAINVCYEHRYNDHNQALSDACQFVHGPQTSLYSASETPDQQHTSSSEPENASLKCYEVRVSPEYLHENLEREYALERIINSFLYRHTRDSIVYWMKSSATFSDSTLLLVWHPDESTLLTEESHDDLAVKEVSLKTCHEHYSQNVDIPAFRHQSVLYTQNGAINPRYYTNCVVAYSNYLAACKTCIEKWFGNWNQASAISGIFSISPGRPHLGRCITGPGVGPACSKFEFIDNIVCKHDKAEKEKTTGVSISDKPSRVSRDIPDFHSSLIQSGDQVSALIAEYDTPECFVCFVLIHNVKFISKQQRYVLMELTTGPWDCKCGTIYYDKSTRNVQTLRPIYVEAAMMHNYGWNVVDHSSDKISDYQEVLRHTPST